MNNFWSLVLIQFAVLIIFYLISLLKKKGDLADLAWCLFVFSWSSLAFWTEGDFAPRNLLIFCLTFVWFIRLAGLIFFKRILKPGEDSRYASFREQWRDEGNSFWKFALLFLLQIIFAGILAIPFHFIYHSWQISWSDYLGLMIFLLGFVGVYLSDYQLAKFKSNPDSKGQVCDAGLWSYSRHPNYFFEFLIWFSYPCFVIGSGYTLFALISPVFMLILLLFVTGVPTSERQALASKGAAYQEYQKKVSKFFPWPPSK